ncbi:unnamed protein product [Prorocentrum cordatum]|uniref:Amino acid transporter n=1 Tax=Prorocentrum cordatum TaxID=2364126 RepID=A0ABN9RZM8_9DINO|nr:unnamed protein product [Polarella glacialis]
MAVLAMLCSLGSAPVPSAGMVLLATMLTSSGVPMTSSFGLVVGIVWIVDRGMTMVNITGDSAVAAIVDRILGDAIDLEHVDAGGGVDQADLASGWPAQDSMEGSWFYAPPEPESEEGSGDETSSLTSD